MKLSPCCGDPRWKACGNKLSQAVRLHILQLQMFLLIGNVSSCGCQLQGLWVDMGNNGSCFNAQIFNECKLKEIFIDGTINFPDGQQSQ